MLADTADTGVSHNSLRCPCTEGIAANTEVKVHRIAGEFVAISAC